jgi:hypothetical protein
MAAKRRVKRARRSDERGSRAGDMPAAEMSEPITQGLSEMPSGADPEMGGQRDTTGAGAGSGLMPGENSTPAGVSAGDMPGSGMSRM